MSIGWLPRDGIGNLDTCSMWLVRLVKLTLLRWIKGLEDYW